MREVLSELGQWTREGEEIAIATVIETWGSSPRPLGSKMLVTRSGKMAGSVSNGCIEGAVFEEAFRRPAQLVIVGAIHIAIPLHRLAKLMGYRVTVVDARAKFATKDRFPEADELIVAWPDAAMAKLDVDSSTYVVILTHDP